MAATITSNSVSTKHEWGPEFYPQYQQQQKIDCLENKYTPLINQQVVKEEIRRETENSL